LKSSGLPNEISLHDYTSCIQSWRKCRNIAHFHAQKPLLSDMASIMPQHEGGSNVGFANLVIWILARGPEYSELVAAAVHLIPGIKKNVLLRNPVPDFLAFTYVIDPDELIFNK
jgi:hypothetical protein